MVKCSQFQRLEGLRGKELPKTPQSSSLLSVSQSSFLSFREHDYSSADHGKCAWEKNEIKLVLQEFSHNAI